MSWRKGGGGGTEEGDVMEEEGRGGKGKAAHRFVLRISGSGLVYRSEERRSGGEEEGKATRGRGSK